MSTLFVADVGGTNIRLAITKDGQLTDIKKYLCKDFVTIGDAIKHYFSQCGDVEFSAGCIAIACPVSNDLVKMTNHSWQFSKVELTKELGLQWLGVINDYTSIAHSLPVLNDDQKVQIGGGETKPHANIAVFGPGTGLGVDHLTYTESGWKALDGEGGHVDFAPQDENDFAIWQFLSHLKGHVSVEEVLSGRGIVHIYQALAAKQETLAEFTDPADITNRAIANQCDLCVATLHQFCKVMGSFAGNLALNLGTAGGVYIAGGIAPRFVEFIQESEFRDRFESKGRFREYVTAIPTYIITEPEHGLIGAAAYLEQNFKG